MLGIDVVYATLEVSIAAALPIAVYDCPESCFLNRRTLPVSRVLLDVLGDTGAPNVVRIRAFGKLALQLARNPR